MTGKAAKRYIKVVAKGMQKKLIPWIVIGYVLLLVNMTLNLMSVNAH